MGFSGIVGVTLSECKDVSHDWPPFFAVVKVKVLPVGSEAVRLESGFGFFHGSPRRRFSGGFFQDEPGVKQGEGFPRAVIAGAEELGDTKCLKGTPKKHGA